MTYWRGVTLISMALLANACSHDREKNNHSALPSSLLEVSGLAAASDTTVFAHDDERAIIHELRVSDGKSLRIFTLGERAVKGDFEGITTSDGSIYLVTSDGLIYAAAIGKHREHVNYRVHDSGIGIRCEIEGLSRAPSSDHLLVLCKQSRSNKKRAHLEIYRWKIGNEHADVDPWLSLPLDDLLKNKKNAKFKPSATEWDSEGKRILIASAGSKGLLILSQTGQMIDNRKLDKKRHPQTEGLTILADRRLVLADEGSRTRRAYLTTYQEPHI